MESKLLKVYYDGLCKVCSREITFYKKQVGSNLIEFIDICSPLFDATAENLDPYKIHKIMHVRRSDGTLAVRVDAFIAIWKTLPKFRLLAQGAEIKIIKAVLEVGYTCFSLIRPFFPRYSKLAECQESPYCELKK